MEKQIHIINKIPADIKLLSFKTSLSSYFTEDINLDYSQNNFHSFLQISDTLYFSETLQKISSIENTVSEQEKTANEKIVLYHYLPDFNTFADYESAFKLIIQKALLLYPKLFTLHKWFFLAALKNYFLNSKLYKNFSEFHRKLDKSLKQKTKLRYYKSIENFFSEEEHFYIYKWILEESDAGLNYKSFEQLYFYSRLNTAEKKLSLNFRQDQNTLSTFILWKNQEKENFIKLLELLNPGKNIVREFIENLYSLNERKDTIDSFLNDFSDIETKEKTDTINYIRNYLHNKRYPLYSKEEKKIKKIIHSFEVPENIQILFPENLEDDYFQILLNVENNKFIKTASKYLASSHTQKKVKKLLKALRLK